MQPAHPTKPKRSKVESKTRARTTRTTRTQKQATPQRTEFDRETLGQFRAYEVADFGDLSICVGKDGEETDNGLQLDGELVAQPAGAHAMEARGCNGCSGGNKCTPIRHTRTRIRIRTCTQGTQKQEVQLYNATETEDAPKRWDYR